MRAFQGRGKGELAPQNHGICLPFPFGSLGRVSLSSRVRHRHEKFVNLFYADRCFLPLFLLLFRTFLPALDAMRFLKP